jgi:glycosyltransferase involved in cell wall biosynthesis
MTVSAEGPAVSVVVPTFNDLGRIDDALCSIINQTLAPAEIVVSDDASEEDVEGFVHDFGASRANGIPIRYVRLARNSGDACARNAGIDAASGAWIAICDSDDIWAPNKLERQMKFLREWKGARRIALLGSHGFNVNDAKKIISPARMEPTSQEGYEAVQRRGGLFFLIHSSAMFSRADHQALGGYCPQDYGAANEFDFFCRLAELGVVLNVPEPLVYYRKRAGSMQLDLFWDRYHNMLRLRENRRRGLGGEDPISAEQYAAQLAAEPALAKIKHRKRAWGMYYYRRGATDMVNNRRLRGSYELALASLLDGARLRSGMRNAISYRSTANPEPLTNA